MSAKNIYLVLMVIGIALPYSQLIPWLLEHQNAPALFFQHAFVNGISSMIALDVGMSAIVLFVFMTMEELGLGLKHKISVVAAVFAVGVSFGLPLYLYFRETQKPSHSQRVSA